MSRPATSTRPSVGGITPASTRMVVDLPAPLRPSRAVAAPGATRRSMPRTASTAPKRTHSASTSTTGPRYGGPGGTRGRVGEGHRSMAPVFRRGGADVGKLGGAGVAVSQVMPRNWRCPRRLPWGAPVFRGKCDGQGRTAARPDVRDRAGSYGDPVSPTTTGRAVRRTAGSAQAGKRSPFSARSTTYAGGSKRSPYAAASSRARATKPVRPAGGALVALHVLDGAAVQGREADAHDRADVRGGRRLDHALVEAAGGLQRHPEQVALLDVDQRDVHAGPAKCSRSPDHRCLRASAG